MRPVVGTLFVEEFRVALPVEPTRIERSVREADEFGFVGTAAREECSARRAGIEPCRVLHYSWVALSDFSVAQVGVEVVADACSQPL